MRRGNREDVVSRSKIATFESRATKQTAVRAPRNLMKYLIDVHDAAMAAGCRISFVRRRFDRFADALIARTIQRPPDFIVGDHANPYLLRWYLLGGRWVNDRKTGEPRWVSRTILGIVRPYLHCFLRSDDDRAHHDHPAPSISAGLRGEATEHTIGAGGIHRRRALKAAQVRFRRSTFAHRIEIAPGAAYWTLFVFFVNVREWGFHCKNGWVPWRKFVAADDPGAIGAGCGEP